MIKKKDKIKDAGYEKHYVYNTHYHLIWCTKYRNQIFTATSFCIICFFTQRCFRRIWGFHSLFLYFHTVYIGAVHIFQCNGLKFGGYKRVTVVFG